MTTTAQLSAETKRKLLHALVDESSPIPKEIAPDTAAAWLRDHALAGLGALCLRERAPEIAALLEMDYFLTTAENSVHEKLFRQTVAALDSAEITPVALKGIALIHTAYPDFAARTMNDIDIWIKSPDVDRAILQLKQIGFARNGEKGARPDALQALADGEIQFLSDEYPRNLIELQRSPFAGWWVQRTANIQQDELFADTVPLAGLPAKQLSGADMVIHLAAHNVITHQLSLYALRAFVDTAYVAQSADWTRLVERAKRWRVATAVWLHLYLADHSVGLAAARDALEQLQPPRWQQRILLKFVSPDQILENVTLDQGVMRFLFLLALPDRLRDAVGLLWRAIWPEKSWLTARYGSPRRWHHLWQVVRFGRI